MLNDCPHRKATNAELLTIKYKVNNGNLVDESYVRCHTCKMQGPLFYDEYAEELATRAWNKLSYEH